MKTEHLLSGFVLRTSFKPLNPTIPETNTQKSPDMPGSPEGKIGLPRANPRGRLNSLFLVAVHGLLIAMASHVAEHGLYGV